MLTLLINQLQLQQRRLEQKLAKVQQRVESDVQVTEGEDYKVETQRERRYARAINNSSHNNEQTITTIRQQSERLYNNTFDPRAGDRVRVTNPRSGQHPWGQPKIFVGTEN